MYHRCRKVTSQVHCSKDNIFFYSQQCFIDATQRSLKHRLFEGLFSIRCCLKVPTGIQLFLRPSLPRLCFLQGDNTSPLSSQLSPTTRGLNSPAGSVLASAWTGLVCEKQSALLHGPRVHGLFWSRPGLDWVGLRAGQTREISRSISVLLYLGRSEFPGFGRLLGAFGHHNNRPGSRTRPDKLWENKANKIIQKFC